MLVLLFSVPFSPTLLACFLFKHIFMLVWCNTVLRLCNILQWNLHNVDTLGPGKSVLIRPGQYFLVSARLPKSLGQSVGIEVFLGEIILAFQAVVSSKVNGTTVSISSYWEFVLLECLQKWTCYCIFYTWYNDLKVTNQVTVNLSIGSKQMRWNR